MSKQVTSGDNITDLRNQLKEAVEEMQNISKEGKITKEQVDRVKELQAEAEGIKTQIDVLENAGTFLASVTGKTTTDEIVSGLAAEHQDRVGGHSADAEKAVAKAQTELYNFWFGKDEFGNNVTADWDFSKIENVGTTGTSAAPRQGLLLPNLVAAEIIKAMRSEDAMLEVSRIIPSTTTASFRWPYVNDTGKVGGSPAQGAKQAGQDVDIDPNSAVLTPSRKTSGLVKVAYDVMTGSVPEFNSFVLSCLAERISRQVNALATTGTNGVVTRVAAGKITRTANADELDLDELVATTYQIDGKYMRNGTVITNRATQGHVVSKKRQAAANQDKALAYTDGLTYSLDAGLGRTVLRLPDGTRWIDNPEVAAVGSAAQAKIAVIGDFNRYVLTHVPSLMRLQRFDNDPDLADEGVIGFIATQYWDGNIVDPEAFRVIQEKA